MGVVAVYEGQHRDVQGSREAGQDLGGIRETVPGQRQLGAAGGMETVYDHEGQAHYVRRGRRNVLGGQGAAVIDEEYIADLDQLAGDLMLLLGEVALLQG
ncbi:hypothetical protein [Streptomyces sp. bgisy034]|uniref:hypothetical protein n=1 Tax=Streptomyces sp. bgisy034 TaxID=3413774 RepID=UPI003EBE18C9